MHHCLQNSLESVEFIDISHKNGYCILTLLNQLPFTSLVSCFQPTIPLGQKSSKSEKEGERLVLMRLKRNKTGIPLPIIIIGYTRPLNNKRDELSAEKSIYCLPDFFLKDT